MEFYPPIFKKSNFHCPLCNVFAKQDFSDLVISEYARNIVTPLSASQCSHCNEYAYWHEEKMIVPSSGNVEMPNPDMPENCKIDYLEARNIINLSPKGATALLRLCVQKLLIDLGLKGNVNDDIGTLVKRGLPAQIQQALDICRVVGNNAVHPGEINLDDSPETAISLFGLINFIVEDQISKPKKVAEMYNFLPERAREAIDKRDAK